MGWQNVGMFLSSYTIGGFSGRAQLHDVINDEKPDIHKNKLSK
jgi:hypothetical protein